MAHSYLGDTGVNMNTTISESPIQFSPTIKSPNRIQPNKPSHVEEINNEIILKQQTSQKRVDEPKTHNNHKSYNIISNTASSTNPSLLQGLPFGYAVRSLERNLEDVHTEAIVRSKGLDPQSPSLSPQRHESYQSQKTQKFNDKKYDPSIFVAGKNNSYGETEFRYANKLPNQEPLAQSQFYGIRALKNLSSLKLY